MERKALDKPLALITGASSGIGQACAKALAGMGYDLYLLARRKERLEALKTELQTTYSVQVRVEQLDVRNRQQVMDLFSQSSSDWWPDVLINNAGLAAGAVAIDAGDHQDWDQMIDTNVKGLLYVSEAIIPQLKSKAHSTIINVGSIAGKEVYPNGNVYCATKHAVDAITQGMRIDLLPHGVRVGSICPGAVETEFSLVRYRGDAAKAKAVYAGYQPLSPDDVAEALAFMVSRPAHVCINDMLIMPAAQASGQHFRREG